MLLSSLAISGGALTVGTLINHTRTSKNANHLQLKLGTALNIERKMRMPHLNPPLSSVIPLRKRYQVSRHSSPSSKTKLGPSLQPTAIFHEVAETRPRFSASSLAMGSLAAGASLFALAMLNGLTPLMIANSMILFAQTNRYGPLLYIAADTIRPLTFFPDALMSIGSGLLFGPIWGSIYSWIGVNTSAMTAYWVGKNLPRKQVVNKERGWIMERYGERIRRKPFESMVIMHGLSLPFDLVNGLAGYLRADWKPFLLGTGVGALPATVACVLIGASIEGTTIRGLPRMNPWVLVASGTVLVSSLTISRYLNKRNNEVEVSALQFIPIAS